jgi:hypothetical protein
MPLTATECKSAKADGKPCKLWDGVGFYLLVMDRRKYWRLDYRFAGKRRTLALGTNPLVSLGERSRGCRSRGGQETSCREARAVAADTFETQKHGRAASLRV